MSSKHRKRKERPQTPDLPPTPASAPDLLKKKDRRVAAFTQQEAAPKIRSKKSKSKNKHKERTPDSSPTKHSSKHSSKKQRTHHAHVPSPSLPFELLEVNLPQSTKKEKKTHKSKEDKAKKSHKHNKKKKERLKAVPLKQLETSPKKHKSHPTSLSSSSSPSSSSSSSHSSIPEWTQHLDHPDYDWLKNPSVKLQVPTFMHLPYLGSDALPKGIDDDDFHSDGGRLYIPFFVCQYRLDLLDVLHAYVADIKLRPNKQLRIAPVGPQGVGKSMYCYLIACFAAVHRFPLIYIPLASHWTRFNDPPKMSRFFLKQFSELNRHWYTPLELKFYQKIEKALSYEVDELTPAQEKQITGVYDLLLEKVQNGFDGCVEKPRFTIIDEHNELFREENPGDAAKSTYPHFFRIFCNWQIAGFSVLCGSAHSKFIASQQDVLRRAIRNLVPFTLAETQAYLTSEATPMPLPLLSDDLLETKQSYVKGIFEICGGVPRILHDAVWILNERRITENPAQYLKSTQSVFFSALAGRFQTYTENPDFNESQFCNFVAAILVSRDGGAPGYHNSIMDPGLFYWSGDNIHFINDYAYELVRLQYLTYRSLVRQPISSRLDGDALGIELEKQVWNSFFLGDIEPSTLYYSSLFVNPAGFEPLGFRVPMSMKYQRFPGESSFDGMAVEPAANTIVFRPLSKQFPRVDFIIFQRDPVLQVYLLQVTASDPITHCNNAGPKDWIGFFNLESVHTRQSARVTWNHLCLKFGIAPSTRVHYIYITSREHYTPQTRPISLPQNAFIGVLTRKNLSHINIEFAPNESSSLSSSSSSSSSSSLPSHGK